MGFPTRLRKAWSLVEFLYFRQQGVFDVSLRWIQKFLGHSSLQTTLVDLHLTETGEQEGRVKLDEIAQPGDLAKRTAQLLPVPDYLVSFTVPDGLRKIVHANQRVCYQAIFDAGSETIRALASGSRFIGTDRIVAVDESSVTYRFTPTGSQQSVTRTVPGNEFVRGFLQHTLPRNFQRLRYYGFASQNIFLKRQLAKPVRRRVPSRCATRKTNTKVSRRHDKSGLLEQRI